MVKYIFHCILYNEFCHLSNNYSRMGKFVLKPEHLVKLQSLIERNLDGFQRGDFEDESVRQTVSKVIVNQFKNYLKIY